MILDVTLGDGDVRAEFRVAKRTLHVSSILDVGLPVQMEDLEGHPLVAHRAVAHGRHLGVVLIGSSWLGNSLDSV